MGCSLKLKAKEGKVFATEMIAFTREARLCAIGRFILPQLFESPVRLTVHSMKTPDGVRQASYEEAVAEAAERLAGFRGTQFTLLAHPRASCEDLYVMEKFTKEVMQSDNFQRVAEDSGKIKIDPKTKAVLTTGAYLDAVWLKKLDLKIATDVFSSDLSKTADASFAAALPSERDVEPSCSFF